MQTAGSAAIVFYGMTGVSFGEKAPDHEEDKRQRSVSVRESMKGVTIRDAAAVDAPALADIYAPYVAASAISFELDPPPAAEMAVRMAATAPYAYLVAELRGQVVGFAYAGQFHPRLAYRWSCTSSIYLAAEAKGQGIGRALYETLLDRLRVRGYRQVFALITQPNEASNAVHEKMGFERCALFKRCGWKMGQWWDVAWYQLDLGGVGGDDGLPPSEPI